MKRWIVPFTIAMVVLYAALAIGAAGCLFLHAAQPSPAHHHSQSHVAHSALCAWACQVNPTVTVHTAIPLAALFAVVAMLWLLGDAPHTGLFTAVSSYPAPPR